MKEELVDYDGTTRLFLERVAHNVVVPLSVDERTFYDDALRLVDEFFPPNAVALAKMVYGKRGASSLYALAETLRRRKDSLSGAVVEPEYKGDPYDEVAARFTFTRGPDGRFAVTTAEAVPLHVQVDPGDVRVVPADPAAFARVAAVVSLVLEAPPQPLSGGA